MTIKCPQCRTENPEGSKFCRECAAPLASGEFSQTKTIRAPAQTLADGCTFAGRYKILKLLGKGGMGEVYKAEDKKLKRAVAIKLLAPERMGDTEARDRFLQEARAAAMLDHPHICTVYEVDETGGLTYMAMSYIKGQSLKGRLKSGPLEISEAVALATQIAEGLREAHEQGIVHRDIKPANIMLTEKGQVRITDFGLAKLSEGADITRSSTIMGTVAYMSPEQAKGEEVDRRTDIWSWGTVLYEMVTGKRPFQKKHEQALLYSILNDEPPQLTYTRMDVPPYVEHIVAKALEKDRDRRYQSARDALHDLRNPLLAPKKPAVPRKSIAVLPFKNLSTDPEQEYFCEGIAEELINALTQIRDLRVAAYTSSSSFKDRDADIKEIGRKLQVDKVLEGSVRKAGNRLRVTVQLVNVDDGYHIWSERYDRDIEDVFAIQDDITLSIVDKLKGNLLAAEKEKLLKRYTENSEAYNLYLKGRYFWARRYQGGLQKGLECFNAAIQKDPMYALA